MNQYLHNLQTVYNNLDQISNLQISNLQISNQDVMKQLIKILYNILRYTERYLQNIIHEYTTCIKNTRNQRWQKGLSQLQITYIKIFILTTIEKIKLHIKKLLIFCNNLIEKIDNQDTLVKLQIIYIKINTMFYMYYKVFDSNTTMNSHILFQETVNHINDFFKRSDQTIKEDILNNYEIYYNIIDALSNKGIPHYQQISHIIFSHKIFTK